MITLSKVIPRCEIKWTSETWMKSYVSGRTNTIVNSPSMPFKFSKHEMVKCTRLKDSLSGEVFTYVTAIVEWTYFAQLIDITKQVEGAFIKNEG